MVQEVFAPVQVTTTEVGVHMLAERRVPVSSTYTKDAMKGAWAGSESGSSSTLHFRPFSVALQAQNENTD